MNKKKKCLKCYKSKSVSLFAREKIRLDGRYPYCKNCVEKYQKIYRLKNKDKINKRSNLYYKEHKEQYYKSSRKWRLANYEKDLQSKRKWRRNNNGKVKALTAKRRANKLKQTPTWANLDKIKQIYINCPKGKVVDHIIPLQGKNVSGFHVEYNLQYLTPYQNLRKGNRCQLK